jgi:hypothetical protein
MVFKYNFPSLAHFIDFMDDAIMFNGVISLNSNGNPNRRDDCAKIVPSVDKQRGNKGPRNMHFSGQIPHTRKNNKQSTIFYATVCTIEDTFDSFVDKPFHKRCKDRWNLVQSELNHYDTDQIDQGKGDYNTGRIFWEPKPESLPLFPNEDARVTRLGEANASIPAQLGYLDTLTLLGMFGIPEKKLIEKFQRFDLYPTANVVNKLLTQARTKVPPAVAKAAILYQQKYLH